MTKLELLKAMEAVPDDIELYLFDDGSQQIHSIRRVGYAPFKKWVSVAGFAQFSLTDHDDPDGYCWVIL